MSFVISVLFPILLKKKTNNNNKKSIIEKTKVRVLGPGVHGAKSTAKTELL